MALFDHHFGLVINVIIIKTIIKSGKIKNPPQIEDGLCAVLYDEQKCKRSADFLSLRPGDSGVLPLISTGLRRNDVESLIVAYRCKLELWDDDKGLEKGTAPDAVVDRSSRLTLGRNKYVDSLADDDDLEDLDEKISAYRCTCRDSAFSG